MISVILALFALGIIGGMFIPFQTSVNAKLSAYTHSTIYTSTISFAVGSLFLIIINMVIHPHLFSWQFLSAQTYDFHWYTGGLIGVTFLIGNLLLLPRVGAALTVVVTLSGQMIMGVTIDVFGWFGAPLQSFTWLKALGIVLLIIGIALMNYTNNKKRKKKSSAMLYFWLVLGFIIGWGPPIQTAINSQLGQQINSTLFAAFVSYFVGFLALLIIKLCTDRNFKLDSGDSTHGKIKLAYFTGGALGVSFIAANIYLMPHLGAALTTIAGMIGQMIMALMIDQFGFLGIPKNKITRQKIIGLLIIIIGVLLLRLF